MRRQIIQLPRHVVADIEERFRRSSSNDTVQYILNCTVKLDVINM